jgi:6-phosphofructokinase
MNNASAVRKNQLINRYIAAKKALAKAENNAQKVRIQYYKAAHLVIYGTPRSVHGLTQGQIRALNNRVANHMRRKVGTMSLRRVSNLPTHLINKIMRM